MNAQPNTFLVDNLISFLSGMGVLGRDKAVGLNYVYDILTRDQLEAAYRTDWIARKIVDLPAKDSTREWRAWQTSNRNIEKIEALENHFLIKKKLFNALRVARLYGGAGLILGVDRGRSNEELPLDSIKADDLKFVHVVSMYNLGTGPIITDLMSPWYGEPEFYTTQDSAGSIITSSKAGEMAFGMVQIHPSRVVPLRGHDFPDAMSSSFGITNPFWGDSVLQVVMDAVKATTMVTQATATMVNETKIDVIKIPELSQQMATKEYRDRLTARFSYANVAKSLINTILLDKEEEWQRINAQFAQLPDLLRVFLLIASGAADIPATRMLGQSPAGLSSTGESDTRNYYDRIHSDQVSDLTPAVSRLDEVLIRSALGKRDPSIFYEWNPLWQLDGIQAADVAFKRAQAFQIDVNTALIDPEALRIGRQNQLIEDGTYPGLEEALEQQATLSMESMVSPEESLNAAQQVIETAKAQAGVAAAQQPQATQPLPPPKTNGSRPAA